MPEHTQGSGVLTYNPAMSCLRMVTALLLCASTSLACAGDDAASEADGTATESGDTAAESGETGEPATATHGTIHIEIAPLGGDPGVFDGTSEIVVTVNYLDCLQGFYLGQGASWAQTGSDGASVFASFADSLCTDFVDAPSFVPPACSVTDITMTVDSNASTYTLQIRYAISDASTLSEAELPVGPLPFQELAGCGPSVEVRSSGVEGFDALGDQIWRIGTVSGSNQASTDQLTPLRVEIVEQ